jgi:hypothetical protein
VPRAPQDSLGRVPELLELTKALEAERIAALGDLIGAQRAYLRLLLLVLLLVLLALLDLLLLPPLFGLLARLLLLLLLGLLAPLARLLELLLLLPARRRRLWIRPARPRGRASALSGWR